MSDDLRAQVARIKPGDKVAATFVHARAGRFTVSGTAYESASSRGYIFVGRHLIRAHASSSGALVSIDNHEPVLPPEPPVGSVVVKDGTAYTRQPAIVPGLPGCDWVAMVGSVNRWGPPENWKVATWRHLADGDVIFTSGGES